MPVRLARLLLSTALIGTAFATSALVSARTTHKTSHAPAHNTATLIWRGDVASANGVINEVASAWEKTGHGRIELQPFNTASGIDAVASGLADIGGSARPADGSAEDARLTFTPVAWDGLVIITQASNPVSNLTLKQVHDIYYGKIHNWSEVGGNNAPIDVYAVASPGDGIEFSLRSLLFGRGNQPVAAPRLYVNTRKLEDGVSLNPNGFGVAMLNGVSGNPKLKMLHIDGKAATTANVANGSYPLFTPLYLVTNPNNPKAAQVQTFLNFVESAQAGSAMRRHGVLPFQDGAALVAMDRSRRGAILAEVGAHASHYTPISMPAATPVTAVAAAATPMAHAVTAAPVVTRNEGLDRVKGSVSDVTVTDVAHAHGSAVTISQSHGKDFKKVDASAKQTLLTYTVLKGDTLAMIAKRHAVDPTELRRWNHLKNDQIKQGQVLLVSNR